MDLKESERKKRRLMSFHNFAYEMRCAQNLPQEYRYYKMSPNESRTMQHMNVELDSEEEDCMISTVDALKQQSTMASFLDSVCETPSTDIDETSTLVLEVANYASEVVKKCQLPSKVRRSTSCPAFCDTTKVKKSVSFALIEIREYEQTIGDNPSVSYGPPISLDWNYEQLEAVDVDAYEGNRGKRRTLPQLMMNYYVRKNTLIHKCGYSEEDLKRATKQAGRVQMQRAVTKYFLPYSKVEEVLTSGVRKAKRVVKGKRSQSV
jgi:hypothetical protein